MRSSTLDRPTSHRDLLAWQEAIKLAVMIHGESAAFPREELYGLTLQLRKSAVSIAANIAEGAARNSTKELLQFLGYASGSRAETDSHLEIARQLGFLPTESEVFEQVALVGKLVTALRKSLRDDTNH